MARDLEQAEAEDFSLQLMEPDDEVVEISGVASSNQGPLSLGA